MMERKKLIILCAVIIVCVAAISATSIMTLTMKSETQINVLSNSSLYNGENVTVQLTTDNGTPIANQTVNVTIINANGEKNVQTPVTNDEGKASFTLGGVATGNYTLECAYGGDDKYEPSNATSTLEIKEEVKVEYTKSTTSSSQYSDPHSDWVCEGDTWYSKKLSDGNYALYDKSSGRMIGTGDMPDRHGYHEEGYVQKYSSTVKYRSNGEYYSG